MSPLMMYIGHNGHVYSCEYSKANILKHMKKKHQISIEMENGSVVNVLPGYSERSYRVSINNPRRNGIYLSVRQQPNGLRTYSAPAYPDFSAWWC